MKANPKFRAGQVVEYEETYCKVLAKRRDTFGWLYQITEWAGWFHEWTLRPLNKRERGPS